MHISIFAYNMLNIRFGKYLPLLPLLLMLAFCSLSCSFKLGYYRSDAVNDTITAGGVMPISCTATSEHTGVIDSVNTYSCIDGANKMYLCSDDGGCILTPGSKHE
jgi:hypothetical protein